MREWAKLKDEVSKYVHQGRMEEHARAQVAMEDLARAEAEQRKRCHDAMEELRLVRKRAQGDLKEMRSLYDRVNAQVAEMDEALNEALSRASTAEATLASMRSAGGSKTKELMKELESLRTQMSTLERKLAAQTETTKKLEKVIAHEQTTARSSQEAARQANLELERALAEREKLEKEMNVDEDAVGTLQRDLAARNREITGLTRRLAAAAEAEASIDKLTKQLQKSERSMAAMQDVHAAEVARLEANIEAQKQAVKRKGEDMKQAVKAKEDELMSIHGADLQSLADKQKEENRERFMKASMRRMLNRDIGLGFRAWVAFTEAKAYALKRMAQIAHRLNPKTRELASAFYFWVDDASEEGRARQLLAYEQREGKMMRIIEQRDKEIRRLTVELEIFNPETKQQAAEREKREAMRKKMLKKQQSKG